MTGKKVDIVPCVAKKGEDDARRISVMHRLWDNLKVLKERTGVDAWAAHGLLDVEEFLESLETGHPHPVLEAWQNRKSEAGNRPPPTSREQHARRLAVLACEALDREGFGTDLACRRFVAQQLATAKIFARAPTAEALRNWRRSQVLPLTPQDQTVIATARQAGTKPEQLVRYFVGLMHQAHTPAPLLKISRSP
jgi:hypothetical protein